VRIAIGSDHAGFALKGLLTEHLRELGHDVIDHGATNQDPVDYPDYAARVARAVAEARAELGVLICGTGVGMSMAANKVRGIRAAAVSEPTSARLAREHNDANVLCVGQRIVGTEQARACVDAFLKSSFQGGRHLPRVAKIRALEEAAGR
jgi:ribose 5-phosphate isomerase B